MTHRPIETLPDGSRKYVGGRIYKPVPDSERKYRRRKPDVEGAVMYNREWVLPLDVLPDEWRPPMPATRSDDEAYYHMAKKNYCKCDVCIRPETRPFKIKWMMDEADGWHENRRGPGQTRMYEPP